MVAQEGEVQTVARALELVDRISRSPDPITASRLAEEAGLPVPTTYRLLRTLIAAGYVRQVPGRRYALGLTLMRLGRIVGSGVGSGAEPFLRDLVDATGETSNFAVLDGDRAVYVAQVPSRHPMRMFTEVGRRVPPHSTGVGKAILAQLTDDQVAAIIARAGLPEATSRTHSTLDDLIADLRRIRERGWAEDDGEQEVGVRCIAAPVRLGGIHAAVSVSGPAARLDDDLVQRIAPIVVRVAAELTEALDGT